MVARGRAQTNVRVGRCSGALGPQTPIQHQRCSSTPAQPSPKSSASSLPPSPAGGCASRPHLCPPLQVPPPSPEQPRSLDACPPSLGRTAQNTGANSLRVCEGLSSRPQAPTEPLVHHRCCARPQGRDPAHSPHLTQSLLKLSAPTCEGGTLGSIAHMGKLRHRREVTPAEVQHQPRKPRPGLCVSGRDSGRTTAILGLGVWVFSAVAMNAGRAPPPWPAWTCAPGRGPPLDRLGPHTHNKPYSLGFK